MQMGEGESRQTEGTSTEMGHRTRKNEREMREDRESGGGRVRAETSSPEWERERDREQPKQRPRRLREQERTGTGTLAPGSWLLVSTTWTHTGTIRAKGVTPRPTLGPVSWGFRERADH